MSTLPRRTAKKTSKAKKTGWLIGGIVLVIAVAVFLIWGSWYWGWFENQQIADPNTQFGEELDGRYQNPAETFIATFPTAPTIVDLAVFNEPVINYYATSQDGKSDYQVTQITDVLTVLRMPAEDLLAQGPKTISRLFSQSLFGQEADFTILKNNYDEQTGITTLEIEIVDATDQNNYGLAKFMAKDNNLMIVFAQGPKNKRRQYQRFLQNFTWLKTENSDTIEPVRGDLVDENFSSPGAALQSLEVITD